MKRLLPLKGDVTNINLHGIIKNIPYQLTKNKVRIHLPKKKLLLTDEQLCLTSDVTDKILDSITKNFPRNIVEILDIKILSDEQLEILKDQSNITNIIEVSPMCEETPLFKKKVKQSESKHIGSDDEQSNQVPNNVNSSKVLKRTCSNVKRKSVNDLHNSAVKTILKILPPKPKVPKKYRKIVTSSEKPYCDENSSGAFKKTSINHEFMLDEDLYPTTPEILPLLSKQKIKRCDMKQAPSTIKTQDNLHGNKIELVKKKANIVLKTLALNNENSELEYNDKNLENLENLSTEVDKIKIVSESSDNGNIENCLININNYMNVNYDENMSESSTIDFDKLSKETINEIALGDTGHSKITENMEVISSNDSENGTCEKFPTIVEKNTNMETEVDEEENCLLKENELDSHDELLSKEILTNFIDEDVKARDEDRLKRPFLYDLATCLNEDVSGNSPLHIAVIEGNIPMIHRQCAALKSRVKNLDMINDNLMTPLLVAIESRCHSIITILLKNGANSAIPDKKGNNAIHLAALCPDVEIGKTLIWNSKEDLDLLDTYNHDGATPLILAVCNNNYIIAENLAKRGYSPNKRDQKSERSALIHALEKNDERLVKLLLDHGADTAVEIFGGISIYDAVFEIEAVSEPIKKMVLEQRGKANDNERRPKKRANAKN